MRAKNGDRFAALWAGDTSRYGGDDSAADLALSTSWRSRPARCRRRWIGCFGNRAAASEVGQPPEGLDVRRATRSPRRSPTAARRSRRRSTIELEEDEATERPAASDRASSAWPTLARRGLDRPVWRVRADGLAAYRSGPGRACSPTRLVLFGNLIGRGPQVAVGDDLHHLNENILVIGDTSTGRKGMALNAAKALFADVDPDWMTTRVMAGLSSGEGLIYAVRDPLLSDERDRRYRRRG